MKRPPAPPLPPRLEGIGELPARKTRREWEIKANDVVRKMAKYFRSTGKENRLDMTPIMNKRRVNAILNTLPEIEKRYAEYPGWDLEKNINGVGDNWINLNLMPCTTYNSQERSCYMMSAAAIWILDQVLQDSENRKELFRLLPRDDHTIDDIYYFPSCWDCNYEYDLILSVVWVLWHRNDDIAPLEMDAYDNPRIWTSDLEAQGKHQSEGTYRRSFERLMSMIPQEAIEEAVASFRAQATAWTDRYFAGLGYLEDEKAKIEKEINETAEIHNQGREHLRETVNQLREELSRKGSSTPRPKTQPFHPLMMNPTMPQTMDSVHQMIQQVSSGESRMGDSFRKRRMNEWEDQYDGDADFALVSREANRLDQLQETYFNLTDKLKEVLQQEIEFTEILERNGYMSREKAIEICGVEAAGDAMEELNISNPYQLCFALLYLIDQDDDLPWLCGVGTGLIYDIADRLPWGYNEYDETEDPAWEVLPEEDEEDEPAQLSFLEPLPQEQNKEKKNPRIPDLYERRYLPKNAEKDADRRSMAQIIYEETGCILPRNMARYDIRWKALKRDYGVGSREADMLLYLMNALGNARRQESALNFDEPIMRLFDEEIEEEVQTAKEETEEANQEITLEEQQETIRKLQAEVRSLQVSLHESEKSNREARKLLEAERADAAREHRELADLREYVFTRENAEQPEEAAAGEDEKLFPYELQKDTVIFGGHDTWLKAIRPMLKGRIRFIDKDLVFDTGLVRHADVIWIQPNALSHSQYYRIIDAARNYDKQVRYFSNASAAIGARQVIHHDQR